MCYVYLMRSLKDLNQTFVGYTADLEKQLKKHNASGSVHTVRFSFILQHIYLGFYY